MLKKYIFAIFSISVMIFGGGLSAYNIAHADDDEGEEREDDEGDENETPVVIEPQPEAVAPEKTESKSESKSKVMKETIVVEPAKIITENIIKIVSMPDKDRDGFIDDEDPHPDVAEIYIVKDDNSNGIVDTFEYGI